MKYNISSAMVNSTRPEQSASTVGHRFHPTDDEMVDHFLKRKLLGHDDDHPLIPEIKVCDFEPWELPGLVTTSSEDQVWYFFCYRDYKYRRSLRSNRTTKVGYWKPTGKPRNVISKRTREEIGTKRSLVFYIKEEQTKPLRTKWIMHEYEHALNSTMPTPGNFVLCKLKSKTEKINQGQPKNMVSDSDLENQNLKEMTAMSTYEKSERDCLAGFDGENRNLEELSNNSAGDEDKSRYYLGCSDVGNEEQHNSNEMSAMSVRDFEVQNPNQKIDISASDMSTSSNSAMLENNAAELDDMLSYINGLGLEELPELEREGSYNSAMYQLPMNPSESYNPAMYQLPMSPSESGTYNSLNACGAADGAEAEMGWVDGLWSM